MEKWNEMASRIRLFFTKTAQVERVWTNVGKYVCVVYTSIFIELLLQFCFSDTIKLWHMILQNSTHLLNLRWLKTQLYLKI